MEKGISALPWVSAVFLPSTKEMKVFNELCNISVYMMNVKGYIASSVS